jgi:hypothetical protein
VDFSRKKVFFFFLANLLLVERVWKDEFFARRRSGIQLYLSSS